MPDSELIIMTVFTEHLLCAKHYFNHSSGSKSFSPLQEETEAQRFVDWPRNLRFISRQLNSCRMLAFMLYIHQHFSMLL